MSRYSFTKESRLLTPDQFSFVFDKASKITSNNILILLRPNNLDHARIGFVFSKKKIKLSIQRNRIRRICRESFRLHNISLKGFDLVVLPKHGISKLSNEELWKELNYLWEKSITL
ncbi:MAG: ribonuclease P protein component [Psittacicella sp.]